MNEDLFSEYGGSCGSGDFRGFDLDGGNGGAADGSFVPSHGSVDSSAASSAASGVSGMSAVSGTSHVSGTSRASGTTDASVSGMA